MNKIIFVSDMFAEQYAGGAELTTGALIAASPYEVKKIQSAELTKSNIEANPNTFWVFGNFTGLSKEVRHHFIKNEKYAVIEYDYKFCKYRNPSLHAKVQDTCDCEKDFNGKLNSLFIHKAQASFWMSEIQKSMHTEKFPFLEKSNSTVLSSIFGDDAIDKMCSMDTSNKSDKWIILNSPSPVKNRDGCIQLAKKHNLDYDLVWGLDYEDLLKKLAESKGLIFLPSGEDTCPRIVIEAKILDCEVVMNSKVQHKDEEWFQDKETMIKYLRERPTVFWKEIEKHV
jgi:hypothetical protein